jgi:hypothetical protein
VRLGKEWNYKLNMCASCVAVDLAHVAECVAFVEKELLFRAPLAAEHRQLHGSPRRRLTCHQDWSLETGAGAGEWETEHRTLVANCALQNCAQAVHGTTKSFACVINTVLIR